jgi:hypothetical protein
MALTLVFSAMAHQGDVSLSRKPLQQAECKFLTVVLDREAASIDGAIQEEFALESPAELGPGDTSGQPITKKPLTGRQ